MRTRAVERLKALILVLMAIFFTDLLVSGKLFLYIGPRFAWLSGLALVLFIVVAGAYNLVRREPDGGYPEHQTSSIWPLLITALPLALGTILPARPLGASAVSTRGVSTVVPVNVGSVLKVEPARRTVLDWVQAMVANPDPAALDGQQADVIGFVYRDVRFSPKQFMVARFTITCCVADALAIGVVVSADDTARYTADSWVRVKGQFHAGELDGQKMAVLVASDIAPIQAPEQPYLYP